jgi:hypothetical protein
MTNSEKMTCAVCGKPFTSRTSGIKQEYCSPACRNRLHKVLREYGEAAFKQALLTTADLKRNNPAAWASGLAARLVPEAERSDTLRMLDEMTDRFFDEAADQEEWASAPDSLVQLFFHVSDKRIAQALAREEPAIAPMPNGNDTEDPAEPALDQAAE